MSEAIETWPGRPYPLGRRLRRRRDELLVVLRGRRGGRALPVRRRRGASSGSGHRGSRRLLLARLPAERVARAALRLPGARAVGRRTRPALQPGQAAPRPLREGDRRPGRLETRPASRTPSATTTCRNDDDSAASCRSRWSTTRTSTGATTGLPTSRCTSRSSTRCTSRASPPAHPGIPAGTAGHLRRPGAPRRHRLPHRPRRHRRRAAARPSVRPRRPPGRAGAAELLGLQLDRLPRPAQRVRRQPASGASRSPSSRRWSGPCTRPASR